MKRRERSSLKKVSFAAAGAALITLSAASATGGSPAEVVSLAQLRAKTHIHGLAVDRDDPSRLLIATHHGLFRAGPNNQAERVSQVQDFMGFNPHPRDASTFYASGHPAAGGNLGFIASTDGGRTWTQISAGVNGPVDFHQMTVSPADPRIIYGAYHGLQLSRDGGKSWTIVGPTPEKLIDLAASAKNADTLYAATEAGLLISIDAGKSWKDFLIGGPVTSVEVAPGGAIYAFVVGRGLMRSADATSGFTEVGGGFGDGYLLHLAIDPQNPDRLFAATARGEVLRSTDHGRTWSALNSSNW